MKNFFLKILQVFLFTLILVGCKEDDEVVTPIQPLPDNQHKVTITQGVWGDVLFLEGDFMPSYGAHSNGGTIKPVEREVFIYEAAKYVDVVGDTLRPYFLYKIDTKFITKTVSDKDGFFQVSLDPGLYSCFVKEDSFYWAGGGDGNGVYMAVNVKSNLVTKTQINIDYKAVY